MIVADDSVLLISYPVTVIFYWARTFFLHCYIGPYMINAPDVGKHITVL